MGVAVREARWLKWLMVVFSVGIVAAAAAGTMAKGTSPLPLVVGLAFALLGAHALRDLVVDRGPILLLDGGGFEFARENVRLPWGEIAALEAQHRGGRWWLFVHLTDPAAHPNLIPRMSLPERPGAIAIYTSTLELDARKLAEVGDQFRRAASPSGIHEPPLALNTAGPKPDDLKWVYAVQPALIAGSIVAVSAVLGSGLLGRQSLGDLSSNERFLLLVGAWIVGFAVVVAWRIWRRTQNPLAYRRNDPIGFNLSDHDWKYSATFLAVGTAMICLVISALWLLGY